MPQTGNSIGVDVNVPPRSRISFNPGSGLNSPWASVLVRLNGGGAAVEEIVSDQNGSSATPCASTASHQWFFADGTTEAGASLQIGLFNPFDQDAIADASFVTDQGNALPQEFQGVVIPAHTMTVLDVNGHVRRRNWVATTISTRSGSIVAAELQSGVINGNAALGLTLGAPETSLNQYIPHLNTNAGRHEGLSLYNPNSVESVVEVDPLLPTGNVQPFTYHVPPQGRMQVNFDTEARVPSGSTFGVHVKVHNGVPVVSQRTVTATAPPGPVAPTSVAAPTGGDFMISPNTLAKQWLVDVAAPAASANEWIYVMNPGTVAATVQLTLVGDGNAAVQPSIHIDPGHTYGLLLNSVSPSAAASVTVASDKDVVVSREIDILTGPGISLAAGIPLRSN